MDFTIDFSKNMPRYLQLAEEIRRRIAEGRIRPGEKMPTVREIAEQTGLSGGTVRQTYGLLEREGLITLSQGRGTFASDPGSGVKSREIRAMEAIDELLETLSGMGFSQREARLFITLKLGQREQNAYLSPVALVDCNPESLNEAFSQLSEFTDIELTSLLLDDVKYAPAELLSPFQMVITTKTHYHMLRAMLPDSYAVEQVVLAATPDTVAEIARVPEGGRCGIFCLTPRFAYIVRKGVGVCRNITNTELNACLSGGDAPLNDFLRNIDCLIAAPDYLSFATRAEIVAIDEFRARGGAVISYHHAIDQGSLLFIEQRIRRLAQSGCKPGIVED